MESLVLEVLRKSDLFTLCFVTVEVKDDSIITRNAMNVYPERVVTGKFGSSVKKNEARALVSFAFKLRFKFQL